ncbi:MAG: phosphatase PAP2 family protein [Candidatus Nanoarchaeia archaeon]
METINKLIHQFLSKDTLKQILYYSITHFSSLGSYPIFLLIIIFYYKFTFFNEAHALLFGLILIYVIGLPIRYVLHFYVFVNTPQYHHKEMEYFNFSSFPSFHAARIVFLSLFFIHFFNYDIDIIVMGLVVSILVCYSRILKKRHFFRDIVGGIIFGSLLWILSYSIFLM